MRAAILTREYPPDVYGGAGVHVDFLVRELRRLIDVDVHCMGEPRDGATAHSEKDPRLGGRERRRCGSCPPTCRSPAPSATPSTWSTPTPGTPTWPATWAKLLYDVPHVVTAHSLEPQRPWKAEQLGGGYRISSWAERTGLRGRRRGRRGERRAWRRTSSRRTRRSTRAGCTSSTTASTPTSTGPTRTPTCSSGSASTSPVRTSPSSAGSPGRRACPHLLRAGLRLDPAMQLVLLAGAADTPELKAETDEAIAALRAERDGVFVVSEMLPRAEVRQVLTHAAGVLLPVGLRAARHREPRGDGLRDRRRGEPGRRHPRGGRRRRDRSAGRPRPGGPRGLRAAVRRRRQRGWRRTRTGPRRWAGRAATGRSTEFGWDAVAARTVELYRSLPVTSSGGVLPES